jgi:dihydrolipoamide dehydrogenase
MANKEIKTQVAVLGGGPGGYSAAFRAADLGKQVTLIEQEQNLGGVCLNVGCIPSKTLLHAAYILDEAKQYSAHGITFAAPKIDLDKLRAAKDGIIKRLAMGIKGLARQRKVELITGKGSFISPNQIEVINTSGESSLVSFEQAIIATGSTPVELPFIPKDPRIMDSTAALNLPEIPEQMLIIGGGIIGLEMATVYSSLGSKVTIVELMDQLVPGMDPDIVEPLKQYNANKFHKILLATKVTKVEAKENGLWVTFEGKNAPTDPQKFDRILVAVGRKPNSKLIAADKASIVIDQKRFVVVNQKMQTNAPHIFAIGDVIGNPMLAHKAVAEGRFVAEIIAGLNPEFHIKNIPSVAYTDPEIATVGLTETEAKAQNIPYDKGVFPWQASGRSLSLGRKEGLTKLLFDPVTKKIIGGSIVGPNAGELISEVALAISLEATAEKIAHVIHPHPTLSETIMMASEVFLGTATDLFLPKK